jgi:SAM-dependent methyltransferase
MSRRTLLARAALRTPARHLAGLAHWGNSVKCACCGNTYSTFGIYGNCWNCRSRARHRQIALLFRNRPSLLRARMRVLHVAPEPAVKRLLPPCDYIAGDLDPSRGMVRVDLTDVAFPDGYFDALIANHVMEHIPNDRAAISEMHRVLRPGGWAIVMTPILVEQTDEDPSVTDPAERLRRFGQDDHVRRYGWDYVSRLEDGGFTVDIIRDHTPEEVRRYSLFNVQGFVEPLFLAHR